MEKKSYYRIEAVAKTFEIIEILAQKPWWELAELSRILSMPKSTIHRIILTLADLGYVIHEKERGAYALSYKLLKTGSHVVNHLNIIDVARPYCRDLMLNLGETVNLVIPSGTEMLVIDKQVTTQLLRQDSIVGGSFAMFPSASGKIYLAFLDQLERQKTIDDIIKNAQKPLSSQTIDTFLQEIETARAALVAFDNEEIYKGVRCVAVPIFGHQGSIVAVLSSSAPTTRFSIEKNELFAEQLRESAQKISLRVGATAYPPQP